jgi:hypothetical protein
LLSPHCRGGGGGGGKTRLREIPWSSRLGVEV